MTLLDARKVVKDEIKRQGMLVSHFRASDITRAAIELMAYENKPKRKQSRSRKGK